MIVYEVWTGSGKNNSWHPTLQNAMEEYERVIETGDETVVMVQKCTTNENQSPKELVLAILNGLGWIMEYEQKAKWEAKDHD